MDYCEKKSKKVEKFVGKKRVVYLNLQNDNELFSVWLKIMQKMQGDNM
jgi:hypothetical protein